MKKLYDSTSLHLEPSNVFIQEVKWSGAGILKWNFLEPSADVIVAAREQGVGHCVVWKTNNYLLIRQSGFFANEVLMHRTCWQQKLFKPLYILCSSSSNLLCYREVSNSKDHKNIRYWRYLWIQVKTMFSQIILMYLTSLYPKK